MQALLLLSDTTRAARDVLEIESAFVERVTDYTAGVGWVPRKGPKPFDDQGTFLLGSGELLGTYLALFSDGQAQGERPK